MQRPNVNFARMAIPTFREKRVFLVITDIRNRKLIVQGSPGWDKFFIPMGLLLIMHDKY